MTIKITAFVIIPILSLLVSNTVYSAQTTAAVTTSATTKAYENSQYGFRILYPVNWYIAPKNTLHSMEFLYYGTDTVVAFVAPIGTFLDVDKHTFLAIGITAVEKSLDKKDLKVKSKSLDDVFPIKLSSYPHQLLLWAAALVMRFSELIQQLLEVISQSRYSILLILVVWLIHST